MTITMNKGKYILKLIMYLIYFIALSILHIAAKKITTVLRKFWSANSIIMWINIIWLVITKAKKINNTKMQYTCFRNILCRLLSQ